MRKIALIIAMLTSLLSIGFVNSPQASSEERLPPCYTGGNAIQVLYIYRSAIGDTSGSQTPDPIDRIRRAIKLANGNLYNESGGQRQLRMYMGGECGIHVTKIGLPGWQLNSISEVRNALMALGYNLTTRTYTVFFERDINNGYPAGFDARDAVSDMDSNATWKTSRNPNNVGPNWAWFGYDSYVSPSNGITYSDDVLHELFHTFGAVLPTAPHHPKANGVPTGDHCFEGWDLMCYADNAAEQELWFVNPNCPVRGSRNDERIDCGRDDYFSLNVGAEVPENHHYLRWNWNTADSSFLIGGGPAASPMPSAAPNLPSDSNMTVNVSGGYATLSGFDTNPNVVGWVIEFRRSSDLEMIKRYYVTNNLSSTQTLQTPVSGLVSGEYYFHLSTVNHLGADQETKVFNLP